MNTPVSGFNLILAILLCGCLGCKSPEEKKNDEAKQATFLRFHLETTADESGRILEAPVYRAYPIVLRVERNAVLDEGFLQKVEIVDVDEHGGLALKLTFDEAGQRRLDALTIEHRGKRFAIRCVWTDNRWLGAPLITRRITNGEFVFTPDASREELERIVKGLRNVIKKLNERYTL